MSVGRLWILLLGVALVWPLAATKAALADGDPQISFEGVTGQQEGETVANNFSGTSAENYTISSSHISGSNVNVTVNGGTLINGPAYSADGFGGESSVVYASNDNNTDNGDCANCSSTITIKFSGDVRLSSFEVLNASSGTADVSVNGVAYTILAYIPGLSILTPSFAGPLNHLTIACSNGCGAFGVDAIAWITTPEPSSLALIVLGFGIVVGLVATRRQTGFSAFEI